MRFIALTFVLLTACAGAEAPVSADAAPISGTPAATDTPRDPTPVAGTPAGQRLGASASGEVVSSCTVDADCAVKNVGSCCGYHPACVNKDSPTFPERVKAECAAKGMSSTCGFQEPAGCACVAGKCASTGSAIGGTGKVE